MFASLTGPTCTQAPNAPQAATYAVSGTASAYARYAPSSVYTLGKDTNTVGVFMSHGQLVRTPIVGGSLGWQTSFNNPNGTVSTTATAVPYAVSLSSYNTA